MNSVYFQGQGEDSLHQNICSVGKQSDTSNLTNIASGFYANASETDYLITPLSSAISDHSLITGTPKHIRAWLMSSRRDSRVSPSVLPASDSRKTTPGINGPKPLIALASYDRSLCCWKMSQVSCLNHTSDEFSGTWPRSGMTVDGKLYPRRKWVPNISGKGCGLWRTPGANDSDGRGVYKSEEKYKKRLTRGKQLSLCNQINFKALWPTPAVQEPGFKHIEIVDKNGNKPTHFNQRIYDKKTGRLVQKGLTQAVTLFPTPTVCGNHNKKGLSKSSGDGLATAIKNYPTPTNSMVTVNDMEQARFSGSGGGRPKYKDSYPTPCTTEARQGIQNRNNPDSKGTQKSLTTKIGGLLNPYWVEWLMHWPMGWTSLNPIKKLVWLDPAIDPHPSPPRTTKNKKDRVSRLKAIGNGQYPDCMATAWKILSGEQ